MEFNTIPEGLDVIATADGELVRLTWYSARSYFTAFMACFWVGFMGFFYSQILRSAHRPPAGFILFTLPHAAVGVGLVYYTLSLFLNKTDVEISGTGVRVAIGPLPWPGSKAIAASEMTGVEVRERRGNRGGVSYSLVYADRDRKEKTFLTSIYHPEQAEFIAFKIRGRLGLGAPQSRPG